MQKSKHIIIACIIFSTVFVLGILANFIRWDETWIEQSIFMTPLGIGFLLEFPFFGLAILSNPSSETIINPAFSSIIVPMIAGMFYAGTYLALARTFFDKK